MHPNPAFRQEPESRALAFAADRGFGTLCVNGPEGPLLAHVPFLLSPGDRVAEMHLVRSNPLARAGEVPAVLAVAGPDAYVSPDWYGLDDQVPTWNYVAVHLRGRLCPMPGSMLPDLLARQSAAFEGRLPKRPWTMDKMTPGTAERMMRQIVPVRLEIAGVAATWKLGQNKPDAVRRAAADPAARSLGAETAALSALMRDPAGEG